MDIVRHGTAPVPRVPVPVDRYFCEWGLVIGSRVRRLRRQRSMSLQTLGQAIGKDDGWGYYSGGYISRLERGRASAPLYVYLAIADVLEVDPGALLGPESATMAVSEAETVLLRWLRARGTEPHEAILRLGGD
jgi:transcriptional regulator with XRE-family HTH domain